jgi:type III secretion system FlhB-like substrate exporter
VKRAIALHYDDRHDDAPVVVSAGRGDLAVRIERAAREHGVPIVRDVPLAEALIDLPVGESIPEALYEAVAALLTEFAGRDGALP